MTRRRRCVLLRSTATASESSSRRSRALHRDRRRTTRATASSARRRQSRPAPHNRRRRSGPRRDSASWRASASSQNTYSAAAVESAATRLSHCRSSLRAASTSFRSRCRGASSGTSCVGVPCGRVVLQPLEVVDRVQRACRRAARRAGWSARRSGSPTRRSLPPAVAAGVRQVVEAAPSTPLERPGPAGRRQRAVPPAPDGQQTRHLAARRRHRRPHRPHRPPAASSAPAMRETRPPNRARSRASAASSPAAPGSLPLHFTVNARWRSESVATITPFGVCSRSNGNGFAWPFMTIGSGTTVVSTHRPRYSHLMRVRRVRPARRRRPRCPAANARHPPRHPIVVPDDDAWQPGRGRADDVPAGRVQVDEVAKRRVREGAMRIVREQRRAGRRPRAAHHPCVRTGAAIGGRCHRRRETEKKRRRSGAAQRVADHGAAPRRCRDRLESDTARPPATTRRPAARRRPRPGARERRRLRAARRRTRPSGSADPPASTAPAASRPARTPPARARAPRPPTR